MNTGRGSLLLFLAAGSVAARLAPDPAGVRSLAAASPGVAIRAGAGAPGEPDATVLEPGAAVSREIAAGQRQVYRVRLDADQYVELRVEQQGVELSLRVSSPDGSELIKARNPTGPHETRLVSFVAAVAGDYRVELTPAARNAAAGSYVVALALPRTPTTGERALDEARRLAAEAAGLIDRGRYDDAMAPARRSLEIRETVLGGGHALVADSLHLIAEVYDNKGSYGEAEPLNLRALAIREKALGPDHQDVARSLFNLGWIYLARQDYAKAEDTYRRALAIDERALGPEHRQVAATLNDLAILYHRQGEYEKAIALDERVLAIRERILGPSAPGVALTLNNLGLDYVRVGDYQRAEACFSRALRLGEQVYAPDHPQIAATMNNLAMAIEDRGDFEAAAALYDRALRILERARGPAHPSVADAVNNLAHAYERLHEYAKAGPLYHRALELRERAQGPSHADVALALHNLASFYLSSGTGSDHEIESLLARSAEIFAASQGPEGVGVAAPLATLGSLYARREQFDRAEELYQRALEIREHGLGPGHPAVADVLGRLGALSAARHDTARALEYWSRYSEVRERNLAHNLPLGSDRQKLGYLALFADDVDRIVSLHTDMAPDDPAALRLAFTTVLRRKGRALDAMADTIRTLRTRADAESRALFASLSDGRARLAELTLGGPEHGNVQVYRARLADVEAETERLEAEIGARSAAFRADSQPVTLEALQAMVPESAALIEFARYRPVVGGRAGGEPRYVAYVMFHDGPPAWVDLGGAARIDRLVGAWRAALRDPARTDVRRLARRVDALVMQPVRSRLGEARQLLVSPDGQLHLVPFAALVDEHGRDLLDRYAISYLTSGRDLLRLRVARASRSGPVVVADPVFGEPALLDARTPDGGGARIDERQMFFGPLPGVAGEVRALRSLLPRATFFTRDAATKSALLDVKGPEMLHIATHGIFLADPEAPPEAAVPGGLERLARAAGARAANPLLRSGLALAGANRSADGVMTALEAASLDLWGTRLVVLSACDTGVGDIRNGEGVFGLKRALVLAGSESQMISLWPVSDAGTRDLIVGYYTALSRGNGRAEALRAVQLKMRRTAAHAHPYYWAAFVLSGQWTGMDETP